MRGEMPCAVSFWCKGNEEHARQTVQFGWWMLLSSFERFEATGGVFNETNQSSRKKINTPFTSVVTIAPWVIVKKWSAFSGKIVCVTERKRKRQIKDRTVKCWEVDHQTLDLCIKEIKDKAVNLVKWPIKLEYLSFKKYILISSWLKQLQYYISTYRLQAYFKN